MHARVVLPHQPYLPACLPTGGMLAWYASGSQQNANLRLKRSTSIPIVTSAGGGGKRTLSAPAPVGPAQHMSEMGRGAKRARAEVRATCRREKFALKKCDFACMFPWQLSHALTEVLTSFDEGYIHQESWDWVGWRSCSANTFPYPLMPLTPTSL